MSNHPRTEAGRSLLRDLWGAFAPGVERNASLAERIRAIEDEAVVCCRTDLRAQCRHGELHSESSGVAVSA